MKNVLAGIATAKQMRKLNRQRKKERKIAEKQRKANETFDPEVIKRTIKRFENTDIGYVLFYGEDDREVIIELYSNFNAYKRAFRKLGYRLRYEHDCSGSGFSISY